MPERIPTADIVDLDAESLEMNDAFPGSFGFHVRLSCDPGEEWAQEFEAVYDGAVYPGKPPVVFQGETLCVFYLPRYRDDLPRYLRFLQARVTETNRAVQRRNAVLPDEDREKELFRQKLREAAKMLK